VLFLVVTKPAPTRPSDVRSNRQKLWEWARPLMDRGVIRDRAMYAKVGRGAMAIFDVASNEELHLLLNQWLDLVPGEVEISPLMDHDAMAAFLNEGPTG
jgi:muconolactone delta-isomerase